MRTSTPHNGRPTVDVALHDRQPQAKETVRDRLWRRRTAAHRHAQPTAELREQRPCDNRLQEQPREFMQNLGGVLGEGQALSTAKPPPADGLGALEQSRLQPRASKHRLKPAMNALVDSWH